MLAKDKIQHMLGGAILALFGLFVSHMPSPLLSISIVIAAAVGWELLQWYRHEGSPDIRDAFMTIFGGAVAILLFHFADHAAMVAPEIPQEIIVGAKLVGYYMLLTYVTWLFYIVCMGLKTAHDAGKLGPTATALAIPPFVIGITLDFLLNVASSVLFWELPWRRREPGGSALNREWMLTWRCERHLRDGSGRQRKLAVWFCRNLDPFQQGGHCKG